MTTDTAVTLADGWYKITYRHLTPAILLVKDNEADGDSVNDWLVAGYSFEPVVVITEAMYNAMLQKSLTGAGIPDTFERLVREATP